jgi:hypothetical protein
MGLTGGAFAQNGFNMPYSQFGIGISEQPYNMPMAIRMGGAVYTRAGNNYTNPFNPASYASVEMESFVFDMGLNIQTTTLREGDNKVFDADGNLGYLSIAMPITRWWKLGGGLMPYTSVDYESVSKSYYTPTDTVKTVYDGTGGASQVFLGSAFNIPAGKSRSLQVGFNVNYLTGSIQRAISFDFLGNDSTYWLNSRRFRDTRLGNFTFDFGLQFRQQLGERYTLGLGLVYKPYRDMTVRDKALIYTYHATDQTLIDTVFPAAGGDPEYGSRLEQAQTFGFGLSLERNKRWQMALDVTLADWADMRYTEDTAHSIMGSSAMSFGPYSRYAFGFEKMGNMDATSYWSRISWSFGAHMSQGALYLTLGGQEQRIDEWGFGLGATMPMRKGRSLLTLSMGYNSMGNSEVLQRNSLTIGISVSSCERWFAKRKYN